MKVRNAGLLPEALLVDLPEIDAQHEEIFHRIEALKATCFESTYVPIEEFGVLLDFFAKHFATEERIAAEAGLEFAEHARVHDDTLRLLHKALGEVVNGAQDVYSFLRYAEYWFERHISEDDRLFISLLQASGFDHYGGVRRSAHSCFSAQA
ncbi:MAG TPA: hemerythrin family protein [Accumulibacter sp.]|uniref:bacteriohemerythrin n=1 Tax=Accumulibacter sp. TaxID=2053492 RepID=UPI0025DC0236|nr:hemerythrin family protein [Accumulibacter sp.]MCM8597973.1 hemerythrin family protein [Accumulibacter sp.]MCM8662142.1 hemerythrin family protein [Accumulibacter sp.]HNC52117.1 hemerythrin family protein [Accumulibacter sp.]